MTQLTLTQEEMREAVEFYLNQKILRTPHKVTEVVTGFQTKGQSAGKPDGSFRITMEKSQAPEPKTPIPREIPTPPARVNEGGKGPLEAAIKGRT